MPKKHVKVPVVMQMEALECGAAALGMVLAYYKKWVPLEQLRLDCGVSRDGSNAINILRAARGYGMEAKAYRYSELDELKKIDYPCILFWNFNHFVVLKGFRGNKAYLNDPARGSITVDMQELDESFTGICLCFKPAAGFQPGGNRRIVLDFLKSRLQGTTAPFLFVMFTGILTALLGIVYPVFSRVFIDNLLPGYSPQWLYPFIGAMSAVVAMQALVMAIRLVNNYKIAFKLAVTSSATFMWHVLRLPIEFFSQRMVGDIEKRQSSNADIVMMLIGQLAPSFINTALVAFYLIIMARYSLLLTAAGVSGIAINAFLSQIIAKKRVNITRVQMRDAGRLRGTLAAGIDMIETIKATGAEEGYFEHWAGYQASVNTAAVKMVRLNQYFGALPGMVTALVNVAILSLGVMLVMNGQFTVGMILAFQGFMSSLLSPVNSLIGMWQSLQETRTNIERINDVLEYPTDVKFADSGETDAACCTRLQGTVEMRDVTFGYSRLAPPLIENFNLQLDVGKTVAFVGPSGSGKSTLANLISGLYKPWSGQILIGSVPIEQIPHEALTGTMAVVNQDIILFEDTIAQNIKLWDDTIPEDRVTNAARDALVHNVILQRDGGYDYRLLDHGSDFSGGERQRLEIARVLAQDPNILIMDEATSALDANTEALVIRNIKNRKLTSIVIAHRLSTIRDSDEIIVLDKGKVVERGTHDELMDKNGLYAQLVATD